MAAARVKRLVSVYAATAIWRFVPRAAQAISSAATRAGETRSRTSPSAADAMKAPPLPRPSSLRAGMADEASWRERARKTGFVAASTAGSESSFESFSAALRVSAARRRKAEGVRPSANSDSSHGASLSMRSEKVSSEGRRISRSVTSSASRASESRSPGVQPSSLKRMESETSMRTATVRSTRRVTVRCRTGCIRTNAARQKAAQRSATSHLPHAGETSRRSRL